jgi:hypothetical protein
MSEHEKRMFRLGMELLSKKFGDKAKPENIHKYLMSSKNKDFIDLVKTINDIADKTKHKYQSDIFRKYGEYGLWVCLNNESLRKTLENVLSRFTKYSNTKIDLKPNMSRLERFIIEKAIIHVIKKMSSKPTYMMIAQEAVEPTNPITRYIMMNIDDCIEDIESNFINKAMKSILWIGMWIGTRDTAYRSQFYYAVNKLGNKELVELSKDFCFEPKDWYINIHTDAHRETNRLHMENKIPRHENCLLEDPCMPKKQKEKIERIIKDIGGAF